MECLHPDFLDSARRAEVNDFVRDTSDVNAQPTCRVLSSEWNLYGGANFISFKVNLPPVDVTLHIFMRCCKQRVTPRIRFTPTTCRPTLLFAK